jgi:hypothetical protein
LSVCLLSLDAEEMKSVFELTHRKPSQGRAREQLEGKFETEVLTLRQHATVLLHVFFDIHELLEAVLVQPVKRRLGLRTHGLVSVINEKTSSARI